MIAVACDHAGFTAKEFIVSLLKEMGRPCQDFGCYDDQDVDYPVFGHKVARAVSKGEFERGILICGTGIGMSIVANRYPGIRAALCYETFTAVCSRTHNDANILVMGARVLGYEQMEEITKIWLDTPFKGGRHARRLEMLEQVGLGEL